MTARESFMADDALLIVSTLTSDEGIVVYHMADQDGRLELVR